MIVFLDSNVVVYFVERPAVWGQKASTRIAASRSGGDRFAISDLVRMECLKKGGQAPRKLGASPRFLRDS